SPHIESVQAAAYVAQERVLRGEVLDGDDRAHPDVLELPLHLVDWEPTYALATFTSAEVEVAEPWTPRAPLEPVEPRAVPPLDEPEIEDALLDLVQPWIAASNGAARAVVVAGDAVAAASALTLDTLSIGRLEVDETVQHLAWAAASGGAHGRRRGAAFGRSMAWYTGALIGDLRWPPAPTDLGRRLAALDWYRWDEGSEEEGWILRIAVHDPEHGWSAALAATDLLDDGA
ncbi:MAG: hypothetical protein M3238_07355, partial [Actinomycetota bacterium]|nr:hypothetical protein [Actinomycetota bacterium]